MNTIDHLTKLHAEATPGEWRVYKNAFYGAVYAGERPVTHSREDCAPCSMEDAALIVAMRNALPALLAVAKAAHRRAYLEALAESFDPEDPVNIALAALGEVKL